tara:strand:+ start:223 stop:660 length:438 start_codon:yes stop_codon:yes gene_type:complete
MVVLVEVVNTNKISCSVGMVEMVYLVKDMMDIMPIMTHKLEHHIIMVVLEAVEKALLVIIYIRNKVALAQPQETQTTMVPPEVVAAVVVDILGVTKAVLVVLVVVAMVLPTRILLKTLLVQAQPILVEVVEELNIIKPVRLEVLE